jgi:hypothetical protein
VSAYPLAPPEPPDIGKNAMTRIEHRLLLWGWVVLAAANMMLIAIAFLTAGA